MQGLVTLMPLTWKTLDTSVQGGCFITAQTSHSKIPGKILLVSGALWHKATSPD